MSIAMTIFSLLGTFIIGFSMFPQTIATLKSRDTATLSLPLYFTMGIATALITIYGIGLVIIPDPTTNPELANIIGNGGFVGENAVKTNWILSFIVPGAAIIFGELICSVTSFIVAFLKIANMRNAKKQGISEAEYVKRLLAAKNKKNASEVEEEVEQKQVKPKTNNSTNKKTVATKTSNAKKTSSNKITSKTSKTTKVKSTKK